MRKFLLLLAVSTALFATQPPARAEIRGPLPVALGQRKDPKSGTVYSISADGQPAEKSRTILLAFTKPAGMLSDFSKYDIATTLRTGKSRTVAQTLGFLRDVFGKFTTGAPAGTVLGKLGAIEKGGEILFFAAAPDTLRLLFKSPDGIERTVEYTRADAANFHALLQPKSGN